MEDSDSQDSEIERLAKSSARSDDDDASSEKSERDVKPHVETHRAAKENDRLLHASSHIYTVKAEKSLGQSIQETFHYFPILILAVFIDLFVRRSFGLMDPDSEYGEAWTYAIQNDALVQYGVGFLILFFWAMYHYARLKPTPEHYYRDFFHPTQVEGVTRDRSKLNDPIQFGCVDAWAKEFQALTEWLMTKKPVAAAELLLAVGEHYKPTSSESNSSSVDEEKTDEIKLTETSEDNAQHSDEDILLARSGQKKEEEAEKILPPPIESKLPNKSYTRQIKQPTQEEWPDYLPPLTEQEAATKGLDVGMRMAYLFRKHPPKGFISGNPISLPKRPVVIPTFNHPPPKKEEPPFIPLTHPQRPAKWPNENNALAFNADKNQLAIGNGYCAEDLFLYVLRTVAFRLNGLHVNPANGSRWKAAVNEVKKIFQTILRDPLFKTDGHFSSEKRAVTWIALLSVMPSCYVCQCDQLLTISAEAFYALNIQNQAQIVRDLLDWELPTFTKALRTKTLQRGARSVALCLLDVLKKYKERIYFQDIFNRTYPQHAAELNRVANGSLYAFEKGQATRIDLVPNTLDSISLEDDEKNERIPLLELPANGFRGRT